MDECTELLQTARFLIFMIRFNCKLVSLCKMIKGIILVISNDPP